MCRSLPLNPIATLYGPYFVRLQVVTVVMLKIQVSLGKKRTIYPMTLHNNPEELTLQQCIWLTAVENL